MGKAQRDKGARFERHVVHVLQDHAIGAERVPLSGAAGGSYSGDVSMPLMGKDMTLECKKRKDGQKQIRAWLGDNYGLVLGADRKEDLVVIRLTDFAKLVACAEKGKSIG